MLKVSLIIFLIRVSWQTHRLKFLTIAKTNNKSLICAPLGEQKTESLPVRKVTYFDKHFFPCWTTCFSLVQYIIEKW